VPNVEKRDYYEVLQVERRADAGTIKTAYRRLALKYHPDKNEGDEGAAEMFKEASEAYQVLSDPQKRQLYDRHGHAGLGGNVGFADMGDILGNLGDLFGAFFGGQSAGGARRGATLRVQLDIDFEEMALGAKKTLTFRRRVPCEDCGGSGATDGKPPVRCDDCRGQGSVITNEGFFSVRRACPRCEGEGSLVQNPCRGCRGEGLVNGRREVEVDIPAGVYDGVTIRVPGEGEPAPRGGVPGDLNVRIRVEEHAVFQRSPNDPADLFLPVPVPITTALLGGSVEIPSLEGTMTLDVPAGTEPGDTLTVRGGGVPRLQSRGRGHLYAHILYDIPRRPSRKLKRALEALRDVEEGEPGPQRKKFSDALKDHERYREKMRKGKRGEDG
jgi:molecular chaperone DnaJ